MLGAGICVSCIQRQPLANFWYVFNQLLSAILFQIRILLQLETAAKEQLVIQHA